MKQIIHTSKAFVNSLLVLSLILLCACGKKEDPKLPGYRDNMQAYVNDLASLSASIDALDTSASDAPQKLLSLLDQMKEDLSGMAALEVPADYSDAGRMAAEASTLMNDAVSLYHEAYEGASYDAGKPIRPGSNTKTP